jgi:hypothetical protein
LLKSNEKLYSFACIWGLWSLSSIQSFKAIPQRVKKTNGYEKKYSKLKKGRNFVNIYDRVMLSCKKVDILVTNKYSKSQSNIPQRV